MFLNGRLQRGVLLLVLALLARMAAAAEPPPKVPEFVPGSWSLVLLPDTQIYAEKFPGLFVAQTAWIARNKDKYDIRYVLHLGDITNGNTQREWRHVQDAFAELDGKVPYALAPGNHDYTPHGVTAGGKSGLNEFFPVAKFKTWPTFGGTMKERRKHQHLPPVQRRGNGLDCVGPRMGPPRCNGRVGQPGAGKTSQTEGDPGDPRLSV